jgi:hypothetical protein
MKKETIKTIKKTEPSHYLLYFEQDGKHSYFTLEDGKWQFNGELPVNESAKLLFDLLAKHCNEFIDLEKYIEWALKYNKDKLIN